MSSYLETIVKYSNYVVRASQRLTVAEQRIIFSAISQIPNRPITIDDEFFITADDYAKLCPSEGADAHAIYRDMQSAVDTLYERSITIDKEDQGKVVGKIKFRWVSSASYLKNSGAVGIRFGYEMVPYVNMLREKFTMFQLQEITGFRSAYTQPLYVRLMQYMRDPKNKNVKQTWTECIEIETLKILLDTKYERYVDIKRYILETACRQINDSPYTQFSVKWEPDEKSKIGKRVTAIRFKMKLKPHIISDTKADTDPDPEQDTLDLFSGITTRQATLSEKQVVMLTDWLTGKNPRPLAEHGLDTAHVYEFLRKRRVVPAQLDVNNQKRYSEWFRQQLIDPEFVKLIAPILRQMGFQFN